ncbi:hypothetical protein HDV05_006259 [Chytridiales sp. JEL 0842]|nr:hypothetical protein HDV05_006259 [Chytridiales sp. JEL 0842]
MWTLLTFLAQLASHHLSPSDTPQQLKVSKVIVYPVKSCAGIELEGAYINEYGFEFDRFWVVADTSTGKMLSQRSHPKMVLIKQKLVTDLNVQNAYSKVGGKLVLSAPGMPDLQVPFRKTFKDLPQKLIDIHSTPVLGLSEGPEPATWFTTFLETPCELYIKSPTSIRTLPERHTPPLDQFSKDYTPQTGFADGFPFLIASEVSLLDIQSKLERESPPGTQMSMQNFRPNIVVAQGDAGGRLDPYEEERWKTVRFKAKEGNEEGETFYIASRCTRCQMPSNNIEKGSFQKEVTSTLMKHRRVDPGSKYEACFGMNAVQQKIGGRIQVGDSLQVLEWTTHDRRVGVWRPDPDYKRK